MPWKKSQVFLEGNDPIFMLGGITLEDFRRALSEIRCKVLRELKRDLRSMDQRLAGLEHDAQQLRLAMEADGHANTKTRERTEGAATEVQGMHGDSCFATRVDSSPKTNSTSFGVKAKPPAPPCRDDVLVENGASAPKSCLPSLEMRSPSAAGGLLPTGETSTATKTILNQPSLRLDLTEEINLKSLTPYVLYDSSFFHTNNLPAAPSCRRVIETKSGENGCSILAVQGRLRVCPFLGSWRVLLCGEVHVSAG